LGTGGVLSCDRLFTLPIVEGIDAAVAWKKQGKTNYLLKQEVNSLSPICGWQSCFNPNVKKNSIFSNEKRKKKKYGRGRGGNGKIGPEEQQIGLSKQALAGKWSSKIMNHNVMFAK